MYRIICFSTRCKLVQKYINLFRIRVAHKSKNFDLEAFNCVSVGQIQQTHQHYSEYCHTHGLLMLPEEQKEFMSYNSVVCASAHHVCVNICIPDYFSRLLWGQVIGCNIIDLHQLVAGDEPTICRTTWTHNTSLCCHA